MKNLKTVIAALGVFAMTIGSGFAMDNNPPTEPVKKSVVEMEVVEEAPMQTPHSGPFYYYDSLGNIVLLPTPWPTNCTITITEQPCMFFNGTTFVRVYGRTVYDPLEDKDILTDPLYEII